VLSLKGIERPGIAALQMFMATRASNHVRISTWRANTRSNYSAKVVKVLASTRYSLVTRISPLPERGLERISGSIPVGWSC
jgi:hypothetical protein